MISISFKLNKQQLVSKEITFIVKALTVHSPKIRLLGLIISIPRALLFTLWIETRRTVTSPEQEVYQQKPPLIMRGSESNGSVYLCIPGTNRVLSPLCIVFAFQSQAQSHFLSQFYLRLRNSLTIVLFEVMLVIILGSNQNIYTRYTISTLLLLNHRIGQACSQNYTWNGWIGRKLHCTIEWSHFLLHKIGLNAAALISSALPWNKSP